MLRGQDILADQHRHPRVVPAGDRYLRSGRVDTLTVSVASLVGNQLVM